MVSDLSVLKRMKAELERAIELAEADKSHREHVRAVRSMCDLLLEEEPVITAKSSVSASVKETNDVSALEWAAMTGKMPNSAKDEKQNNPYGDNEANGKSLFDF